MPSTIRLENSIDDAINEMKAIEDAAFMLRVSVEALVEGFLVQYPRADTDDLKADFASRLSDIVSDLQGPAYRRKIRLEDELGRIEDADMRRNAPVVL